MGAVSSCLQGLSAPGMGRGPAGGGGGGGTPGKPWRWAGQAVPPLGRRPLHRGLSVTGSLRRRRRGCGVGVCPSLAMHPALRHRRCASVSVAYGPIGPASCSHAMVQTII